jgi:hypothetical protein
MPKKSVTDLGLSRDVLPTEQRLCVVLSVCQHSDFSELLKRFGSNLVLGEAYLLVAE